MSSESGKGEDRSQEPLLELHTGQKSGVPPGRERPGLEPTARGRPAITVIIMRVSAVFWDAASFGCGCRIILGVQHVLLCKASGAPGSSTGSSEVGACAPKMASGSPILRLC